MNTLRFRVEVQCDSHTLLQDDQFAEMLSLHAATLAKNYSRGSIPAVTVHGCDVIGPEECLRFIASQAAFCRQKETHEALCILVPALMKMTGLIPMNGYEETEFRKTFKAALNPQIQEVRS